MKIYLDVDMSGNRSSTAIKQYEDSFGYVSIGRSAEYGKPDIKFIKVQIKGVDIEFYCSEKYILLWKSLDTNDKKSDFIFQMFRDNLTKDILKKIVINR